MRIKLLSALKHYCENENKDIEDILKDLEDLFEYSNKAIKSELNREISSRNYNKYVAIFNSLYGVDLKYFNLDKEPVFNKVLGDRFKGKSDVFQLGGFSDSDAFVNKTLKEEYFKKSKEFLNHISHKLTVYDYLRRFDNQTKEHKIPYIKAHSDIFKNINRIIGIPEEDNNTVQGKSIKLVPKIKYTRFFTIPDKCIDYERKSSGSALESAIINAMSLPLLKHVHACLRSFEEFDSEDMSIDYGFYLLNYSRYNYHFAYTDNGSYCLTEKYRSDRQGALKLDLLFIEQSSGEIKKLSRMYKHAFDRMFNYEGLEKLTLNKLKDHFKDDIQIHNEKLLKNKNYEPINVQEQKIVYAAKHLW